MTLPVGEPVAAKPGTDTPRKMDRAGKFITLSPTNPDSDRGMLYECSHGSEQREELWTYMGYGPFADADAMRQWLIQCSESEDPFFLTVRECNSGSPVGMVGFLNIVPEARRLEIGHIWYAPDAQRTKTNTEAVYLLLCEAFDRLEYRRVEWKCDSLNARSRAAAARLAFQYEGVFRQHLIVKGRNRDTAWFSMLDGEWSAVKKNMELWLYDNEDGKLSLKDLNAG